MGTCHAGEPIEPSVPKAAWPEINFENEKSGKVQVNSKNRQNPIDSDDCGSPKKDSFQIPTASLTPRSSSRYQNNSDLVSVGDGDTNKQSRRRGSHGSQESRLSTGSMILRNSVAIKHIHEKAVTAEDILTAVLKQVHVIIQKQADTNTPDQNALIALAVYLQRPRKLIAGISREQMMRAEAQQALKDGFDAKDAQVSNWIQDMMNCNKDGDRHNNQKAEDAPKDRRDSKEEGTLGALAEDEKSVNRSYTSVSTIVIDEEAAVPILVDKNSVAVTNSNQHGWRKTITNLASSVEQGATAVFDSISTVSSSLRLSKMYQMLNTNKELNECLSGIHKWQFNAFELTQFTATRGLTLIGLYAMRTFDLFNKFHIGQTNFLAFFEKIEDLYRNNPYHNSLHAADVLASEIFWLTNCEHVSSKLEAIDLLTCIVAAAIHDVDHPGTTSDFEIRTSSDIALQYNDTSVLENYHLSVTFRVLKKAKYNIFQRFTPQIRKEVRKALIQMVLTTDISKHLEHVAMVKDYASQQEILAASTDSNDPNAAANGNENSSNNMMNRSQVRTLLRNISIKCSDLSNPTRPLNVALLWTERITQEFMAQGDRERALGLPVTPTMDRTKANIELSQIAFIDHIIIPLFESWFQISSVAIIPLQNLLIVRNYWLKKVEDKTGEKQPALRRKARLLKELISRQLQLHTC